MLDLVPQTQENHVLRAIKSASILLSQLHNSTFGEMESGILILCTVAYASQSEPGQTSGAGRKVRCPSLARTLQICID